MAASVEGRTASRYRPINVRRYAAIMAGVWSVLVAAALFHNLKVYRTGIVESARIEARSAFERDISYRRWAAGHGCVYVPVSEHTPPNPYLAHLPNRDVTTESGMRLTLVNPAYVTRQVHEIAGAGGRYRAHITSLHPIRPENAPDPWERIALQRLDGGEEEVSSLEMMDDKEHLRLMRPLRTEKACLAPSGVPVVSDERRGRQIVINLVNNAVKFTEHGRVEVKVDADDGQATVRVTDTGPGISAADQARLFEPFGRQKGQGAEMEGTGLGLYLCMKTAALLGGNISVSSTPGEGSAFTLSLPGGEG